MIDGIENDLDGVGRPRGMVEADLNDEMPRDSVMRAGDTRDGMLEALAHIG